MMHSIAQFDHLYCGISRVKGSIPTGATNARAKKSFTNDNLMWFGSIYSSSTSPALQLNWKLFTAQSIGRYKYIYVANEYKYLVSSLLKPFGNITSQRLLAHKFPSLPSLLSLSGFPTGGARRPVIWLSWLVWSNTCPLSGEGARLSARSYHCL